MNQKTRTLFESLVNRRRVMCQKAVLTQILDMERRGIDPYTSVDTVIERIPASKFPVESGCRTAVKDLKAAWKTISKYLDTQEAYRESLERKKQETLAAIDDVADNLIMDVLAGECAMDLTDLKSRLSPKKWTS